MPCFEGRDHFREALIRPQTSGKLQQPGVYLTARL